MLLNLAGKTYNMFNAMDKNIFESVMAGKRLWERNSADDNDNINSLEAHAPGLTHHEALQAELMLRKYIRTINNPFSNKFKMMLGSFGQQTHVAKIHDMKDTNLADYFSCK
ncbi:hypothetical protein PAXRUDRAFT_139034 [Paxillus rubicundulus Ve08.2h10]|uniref:Uncharacterized protein n=1 Tax=Paxillus rubicundulus Ve08.2h10 TaxID=930991 RepID=A0A0D0E4N1_9AGAM|nr:hypothetical protein PAXRUDRAFT_139034 [Paxillus rubicundulus Ve08.2h10]